MSETSLWIINNSQVSCGAHFRQKIFLATLVGIDALQDSFCNIVKFPINGIKMSMWFICKKFPLADMNQCFAVQISTHV